MIAKLERNGLIGTRVRTNIGHNPWRMTFVSVHAP